MADLAMAQEETPSFFDDQDDEVTFWSLFQNPSKWDRKEKSYRKEDPVGRQGVWYSPSKKALKEAVVIQSNQI